MSINCDYCGSSIDTTKHNACPFCGASYNNNQEYQENLKLEKELNNNERFVCSFAGFLTEAMTTADYPEDIFNKMLLDLKTNPLSKKIE